MNQLSLIHNRKDKAEWFIVIECPACHLKQAFVNSGKQNIWFPFAPYCCNEMRHSDDVLWNAKLDKAIERELYDVYNRC